MKLTVENFESNFRQKKKTGKKSRQTLVISRKGKSTVDGMMLLNSPLMSFHSIIY